MKSHVRVFRGDRGNTVMWVAGDGSADDSHDPRGVQRAAGRQRLDGRRDAYRCEAEGRRHERADRLPGASNEPRGAQQGVRNGEATLQ